MEDATVVGRHIVIVQKQTFLHWKKSQPAAIGWRIAESNLHLLKLVTGVEISTRDVNKSGRLGKATKSNNRKSAAPA